MNKGCLTQTHWSLAPDLVVATHTTCHVDTLKLTACHPEGQATLINANDKVIKLYVIR